jgi:hypothetical protein
MFLQFAWSFLSLMSSNAFFKLPSDLYPNICGIPVRSMDSAHTSVLCLSSGATVVGGVLSATVVGATEGWGSSPHRNVPSPLVPTRDRIVPMHGQW